MGSKEPELDAIKFVSKRTRLDSRRIERVLHEDIIRDWFVSVTDPAAGIARKSAIETESLQIQREIVRIRVELSQIEQRMKTGDKAVLSKRIEDFIKLVNRVAENTNEDLGTVLKIIKAMSDYKNGIKSIKRPKYS